ncbi:MAG: VWA domain-containing protein [Spirochaetota bacterium]
MHICRYYHDDDQLPDTIRTELEGTLFESFARGGEVRREPGEAIPTPIRRTIDRLTGTVTFGRFTRSNERLSERLAHEAVHWVGTRWREIEETDPFAEEEAALHEIEHRGESANVERIAEEMARHRPELAGVRRLVTTQDGPLGDATKPDGRDERRRQIDREARLNVLRRRWRERFENDRTHHRARILGRALGGFIRELEGLVPRLAEEQETVRDALGNEDALWDLSMHEWEELPLGGLEAAARMLEEHREIERLAEMLGKSKTVTELRTVERVERSVRFRPVGIGKSEITGIRAGDDLTSVIASEVALLSQPETEDLFFTKLAMRELLVLDYNRRRIVEHVDERKVSVSEEVPLERGPAIVCVDTSGSMLGLPERVAKATVLALAKRLSVDRRPVRVIAFSSQVRSFELDHDRTNLGDLARFLEGSFHGGTDLGKALATALDVLREGAFENADVLVISDFRVPKIADRYLEQITAQHRKGTLFHSLTIARAPVIDPLHIFDSAWLFSTESGRIAPESLRTIT